MIPSSKPAYAFRDLQAALFHGSGSVDSFEQELAAHFGFKAAITFPLARIALYSILKVLNKPEGDVVQPAYNCAVVAHATVLAGNRPVFTDASSSLPNQDEEQMAQAVGPQTAAVIPTSIYGVTFDINALCEKIRLQNRDACILVDCCQAFDTRWKGQLLMQAGDGALLSFGVSKPMTTLEGGALLTNRRDLATAVRSFRDRHYFKPPAIAVFGHLRHFMMSWAVSTTALTPLMDFLMDFAIHSNTRLGRYLRTLRSRERISLIGNETLMHPMAAAIGREQLRRASDFMRRHLEIAATYDNAFQQLPCLDVMPWTEGSTYTIYTVRLKRAEDRDRVIGIMRKRGIQCGTMINYVVPGLDCYQRRGFAAGPFPNARSWSVSVLNLPCYPSMTDRQVEKVIRAVKDVMTGLLQRESKRGLCQEA